MKEHLIRVHVEKKFLHVFRIIMLVVAGACFIPIWNAIDNGYVIYRGEKGTFLELLFYMYLVKYFLITGLFVWLGTGGVHEKKNDDLT
jgi:hypothetical protein